MRRKLLDASTANKYLDAVAEFLCLRYPGYESLPTDTLDKMESIWLTIATNRKEFIEVLDKLKTPRKKSCKN